MIFIVAGDFRVASNVAYRIGLHSDQWSYVSTPVDVRGYGKPIVFVTSEAYRNRYFDEILATLRAMQAQIWYERDYARL